MTGGIAFAKGHGTQNDFVVLPDPDASLDLTAARVAALCDRRRGLGADGVLRVVRWAKVAGTAGVPDADPGVEWFMDYRNADGSAVEMCGNGVRVFARYLDERGWGPVAAVGTRGGVRTVAVHGDEVSVGMGPATVGPESVATLGGRRFRGVAVDLGNPHLACVTGADLGELDLTVAPEFDRALFPDGVNVEFCTPLAGGDRIAMRVHERGVGETRSCGTGTVAAVVAALRAEGRDSGEVTVDTPGGALRVSVMGRDSGEVTVDTPGGALRVGITAGETTLHGPAVIVARGELDRSWWAGSIPCDVP